MSAASGNHQWRDDLQRVLDLRWTIIAVVGVASGVLAGGRGDWDLFVVASRDLMGGDAGLGVFVAHRDVQTGPLTLVATWALSYLPRHGFGAGVVLVLVAGVWALRQLEVAAADVWPDDAARRLSTLLGGIVVMGLWGQLAGYGHLDDAVVLALAVRCVARRDRAIVRAVLVGLAVGVKPWAVVLVPLVLDWPPLPRRPRELVDWLRPAALAAAVGAACWLPFVIHSPETTDSLKPTVSLAADSVLQLLGLRSSDVPAAVRVAQLVGAMAVAVWCCATGRWAGALMAALAVRMATDLGTWSYYTPGLLVAALAWDQLVRRRSVPLLTVVTAALLPLPWMIDSPDARAVMRLVACVLVVAVAVSVRVPSAGRSCPSSDPPAGG